MKLGKIEHVGIIVEDIYEACVRYSETFGIKKWYEISVSDDMLTYYKGKKVNSKIRIFLGGKGRTKLELIETAGDPNLYSGYFERHGEDIHHMGYSVKNLEKAVVQLEQQGMKVFQNASFQSGSATVRTAYVGWEEDAVLFELVETQLPLGIKKGYIPGEVGLLGVISKSYKRVKI